MEQMLDYPTCQVCGQNTTKDATDGWLISPRRYGRHPRLVVIRCPRHISKWALRESCAGVTKEWVKKMEEGKKLPPPSIPPFLTPYVMGLPPEGE